MREIKFRAWNKLCDCKQCVAIPHERLLATRYGDGRCFLADEDLIIEQFTGLHDKNGKEIYEGDVVCFSREMSRFKKQVRWDDYLLCWEFGSRGYVGNLYEEEINSMEIIGNIHENPELINNA